MKMNLDNLKYYNFYNLDISIPQYLTALYYKEHTDDDIDKDQKLSYVCVDIECYADHKEFEWGVDSESAPYPISCITIYDQNKYTSLFLKHHKHKDLDFSNIKSKLVELEYLHENDILDIIIFDDEKELLNKLWKIIHEKDPHILTGYNSDNFDYPYIYHRMLTLYNNDKKLVNNIVSKFGSVTNKYGRIEILEFSIADVLYMFKPRDENGLNYGKKQQSYALNNIAGIFLNKKKLKEPDISLDTLYETDPNGYLMYNIADVILTNDLYTKFNHVEIHNLLRRVARCPFHLSMRGISLTFESFIYYKLLLENKYVRYGINNEKGKSLSTFDLKDIPKPRTSKQVIKETAISKEEFNEYTCKYSGAYVKTPVPKIINDGSLIIDLDASALYPSMIQQHNICFDTFRGVIIQPCGYKILDLLSTQKIDNKTKTQISNNLFEYTLKHVASTSYENKSNAIRNLYYISNYLLYKIIDYNNFDNICNPKSDDDILMLKHYLIPFLDTLNTIHPNGNIDYNQFVYDYLFGDTSNYKYIYIYNGPMSSKSNLMKITDYSEYIQNYNVTINGCLFDKHEKKLGLFLRPLGNMRVLRTEYKRKRDESASQPELYKFYDSRQNTCKIFMNSTYGVYGLSTFKFSSHHLAQSITSQGKLINKIAQQITDDTLKTLEIIES
jgi:DNA polymerase elongation subunit (family B)